MCEISGRVFCHWVVFVPERMVRGEFEEEDVQGVRIRAAMIVF